MIESVLENTLKEVGLICIETKGTSMNPLLYSGKNKVLIVKANGKLKKHDIVLYKRDNGIYVLHRIMKVLGDSYVLCGDNHCFLEYGITDKHILGVAEGYYNGEKYIEFSKSFRYKIYKFFWCNSLTFRAFLIKLRVIPNKIKKIFKKKNP